MNLKGLPWAGERSQSSPFSKNVKPFALTPAPIKQAVANYNVAVREWNEEIIFLHKILPGAADKSYGIQVARLAGLPKVVVERAKSILSHLELHSVKPEQKKQGPKAKNTVQDEFPKPNPPQMDLFADF